jgi:hypothetical protein
VPSAADKVDPELILSGFVTDAYLALSMHWHWGRHCKWLQTGRWSWLALGLQSTRLVDVAYPMPKALLVIDDTEVLRSSTKAPSVAIHHQHGRKCNRPDNVRGQCRVSLSTVLTQERRSVAIPQLNRLTCQAANTNRLDIAMTLVLAVRSVFLDAIVLLGSWYRRQKVIRHTRQQVYGVMGQMRKDTVLYACPVLPERRQLGRPWHYGENYTANRLPALPEQRTTLTLYGNRQIVRYRSAVVMARFVGDQRGLRRFGCNLKTDKAS